MIKLTFCLHRLPTLTRAEFQDYWRTHHAPLVAAARDALGIRRYVQQHTIASPIGTASAEARGIPHGDNSGGPNGDSADYDGVAELWFDSETALAATGTIEAGTKHARILLEDEAKFIDFTRSRMFMTEGVEVIGAWLLGRRLVAMRRRA